MTVISFIGAGSVEFTRDLIADLLGFPDLGDLTLRLHDIDSERLRVAEAVAKSVASQLGARPTFTGHADRRSALDGADFVINIIQVGGLAATRTDFEVPSRYGVAQTIGDTLGIGAIFRGLRTFPVLAGIAADMAEVCPEAMLLNYTNPMAMNVWFLRDGPGHPRGRALPLGLLDGGRAERGNRRTGPGDHISFGRGQSSGVVVALGASGPRPVSAARRADSDRPRASSPVRVDMYRRLGFYPTETSEHSSEYVPWYLGHPGEIDRLRIPVDTYLEISADNVTQFEQTREQLDSGGQIEFETEATEYAPQVIHSMVTGQRRRIQANLANTGLITNLPSGAAVEVPCEVDGFGLHPAYVGDLPPQCAALNRNFLNVVELTVRAALEEDPRMVRQDAMLDPHTAAVLEVDQIWSLCDDLVEAHGDLMPDWLRGTLAPTP